MAVLRIQNNYSRIRILTKGTRKVLEFMQKNYIVKEWSLYVTTLRIPIKQYFGSKIPIHGYGSQKNYSFIGILKVVTFPDHS